MNIAAILEKCPKGMKLYSPVYGEVKLKNVDYEEEYPITCIIRNRDLDFFTSDGRIYCEFPDAECVLFPSKDQRDWNKFIVPDQKTKYQFKPFERVLVRDDDDDKWKCDFFSHIDNDGYTCVSTWWKYCIPYEGNEHLLGTIDKPE